MQSGSFFPKSGHFSWFSKKGRRGPPYPSSCVLDKIVFQNCSSTSYLFSIYFWCFFLDTFKTTFWKEYLTQKMDMIRVSFSKIRVFFSIFKKGQGRFPPYPSSCAPAKIVFWNCSSTSSYLFSIWRKDSFIFVLQILAIETAIDRCSNNSGILQKAVLYSNCYALSILPYHFFNFPIIMPFDLFTSYVSS